MSNPARITQVCNLDGDDVNAVGLVLLKLLGRLHVCSLAEIHSGNVVGKQVTVSDDQSNYPHGGATTRTNSRCLLAFLTRVDFALAGLDSEAFEHRFGFTRRAYSTTHVSTIRPSRRSATDWLGTFVTLIHDLVQTLRAAGEVGKVA